MSIKFHFERKGKGYIHGFRVNGTVLHERISWSDSLVISSNDGVVCDGKLLAEYEAGDIWKADVLADSIGMANNVQWPKPPK